jgi:uncharacterized 2Fe-2S/4Fe-4S cluster protein (DUF4445 family)
MMSAKCLPERGPSVHKILVEPIGVTVEVAGNDTLLAAVSSAAVALPVDCAGRGTCGKCLVRLGAGELSPPTSVELRKVTPERRAQGWRLACQAQPLSERVSIEVRQTAGRRQILTASKLTHGEAHPAVTRQAVSLPRATFDDARSDRERVRNELGATTVPLSVLRRLPTMLREGRFSATTTMYEGSLIDIERKDAGVSAYGAAVDIGTSKIIVYLMDLREGLLIDQEAMENPQMHFGEDVITRITEALEEEPLVELSRLVIEGINVTLAGLCKRQEISARHVYDMVVVGNTAMHHLALGLSPHGLSGAPFAPALDEPISVRAADLGVAINSEGRVYFMPPIAGFVGSDCLAVVAATHLEAKHLPAMAIDIGTNTEIALVKDGTVWVTSCASGPAFEGYQITCGMKATEGAIERVTFTVDGHPRSIETIGHLAPLGLCGSGVVDVLAGLIGTGVVDESGLMQPHERVRRGAHGLEYLLAEAGNDDIVFTQRDVRALQLAKGAIAAGWSLLLAHAGLTPGDLRHIYVAGAFGNYLNLDNALAVGLLPRIAKNRIAFVGNAAGVGAQMALIDVRQRERIAELRRKITFRELAMDAQFHEVFLREMSFAPR